MYIRELVLPPMSPVKPIKLDRKHQKVICFDLDETLVHCLEDPDQESDHKIAVRFPGGETIRAGLNIRPYARECLQKAASLYTLVSFTAS